MEPYCFFHIAFNWKCITYNSFMNELERSDLSARSILTLLSGRPELLCPAALNGSQIEYSGKQLANANLNVILNYRCLKDGSRT